MDLQTTQAQKDAASGAMQAWMKANLEPKLGMKDSITETRAVDLFRDTKTGQWNAQIDQVYKGIKVRGGHLDVHGYVDGNTVTNTHWAGEYLNNPEVDINPKINPQKAIEIATKMLKDQLKNKGGEVANDDPNGKDKPNKSLMVDSGNTSATANLEIHKGDGPGKRKLTYHVAVSGKAKDGPVQLHAWVDQDGNILEAYDNTQTACYDGLGATLYQGYQGVYFGSSYGFGYFKVYPAYGGYVLNDNCLRWGTYDNYNGSTTYQAFNSGILFGNLATSNRESSNADVAASSQQTYSFEYWVLGRNGPNGSNGPGLYGSVDGLGSLVSARNHVGVNYVNAFWDGGATNFGDGDGVNSGPLTSLDVVAHEWQHAVTQFTANLVYSNESGAINESFSDIMGSMAERYWYGETSTGACGRNTWKMGELVWTPGNGNCDALRYLYAPWLAGNPWYYPSRYTGTADNGGVHSNSGISNYAFYIISKGGCGTFCIGPYGGGIGADASTWIFWRAERVYMGPYDGFAELRQKTLWAAADGYGYNSAPWQQVRNAWDAVGVPHMCTWWFFGSCLAYGD